MQKLLTWLNRGLLVLSGAMILAMMVHICADVASRFFLSKPLVGTTEFVTYYYMVACIFLALPVVQVVGMRLGCLNHALLTAEAIASRGLALAGWIANHVEPQMTAADENVRALETLITAPLLARIAFTAMPRSAVNAALLDTRKLL